MGAYAVRDRPAVRASLDKVFDLFPILAERRTQTGGTLSGGEQQRVALARALAHKPRLILADEPTGNLDSTSGADILKILDQLHSEGKTLIVVTHDEQIATRAQRVIRLFDGRIDKEEFNHKPASAGT